MGSGLTGETPVVEDAIADDTALMRYGQVRRIIRTERFGLRQPRGIAFHPDGQRYAVSGYWNDIALLERGSHQLDRDGTIYTTLFGHSHMTLV